MTQREMRRDVALHLLQRGYELNKGTDTCCVWRSGTFIRKIQTVLEKHM